MERIYTDRPDRPVPERDPGSRRRLDGDQMRDRDAAVAKMLAQHVPYRTICARLDMSYGSLQQTVRRLRGEVPERERVARVPQHQSRFASADDDW